MRYELSDSEWSVIDAMLPNKPRGVPRVDDRRVLNGIFWILRSGAPWRDLPAIYGPRTTCYNRFVRWRRAGIWESIMKALAARHDAPVQMIDTSMVRVHQHGACIADGARQALGRSRGGLARWQRKLAFPTLRSAGCGWRSACSRTVARRSSCRTTRYSSTRYAISSAFIFPRPTEPSSLA